MITKELLLEAARRKGLTNREHIEKDYLQDVLLYNIYRKTNQLVFKGGTALYKLYSLPRFSEDLDFSMLGDVDAKRAVEEAVRGISGAGIRETKVMKGSVLIRIGFTGVLTRYNTLRVDISTGNPVLAGFDVKTYVPEYVDINPFSIRALKPEEMLAEKVHSLFARGSARDLYDLFFLARLARVDGKLVRGKLNNFGMKYDFRALNRRIGNLKRLWVPELRPFLLAELPDFRAVRDFVIEKLKTMK